jgi:phosphoglycolate phosphatase-like HAD superfamily hydrolase
MTKPLIALDCDGVLLDLNLAYATAWARYSGTYPAERDPHAYWHHERWDVQRLSGEQMVEFRTFFDTDFWSHLPQIAGAVQACQRLHDHGHELVCVTALEEKFADARLENLRSHGFPISKVFATGHQEGQESPKAAVIHQLQPVAFVDDYLPYMDGIRPDIHTALILRGPNGSPNVGPALNLVGSTHADLSAFTDWWLAKA